MADLLKDGLLELGCENADDLAGKMEKYIGEIVLFNSAYNLTNTSVHDELVVRHIFDSLAPYSYFKKIFDEKSGKITVGDIGSGGGLPGIPLAAAFPSVNFKLVERMSKRCAFLENCVAILGLKNVEVICSEAEKLGSETFDFITFRAFRPLDEKMTKTLLKVIKNDGAMFAYKAKMENIKEEMAAISALTGGYEVYKLEVPGLEDSERNLVVVKKSRVSLKKSFSMLF